MKKESKKKLKIEFLKAKIGELESKVILIERLQNKKIKDINSLIDGIKEEIKKERKIGFWKNLLQIISLPLSLIAIVATFSTNANRIEIAKESGQFDKPKPAISIGDYYFNASDTINIFAVTEMEFKDFDFIKIPIKVENQGMKNTKDFEMVLDYPDCEHYDYSGYIHRLIGKKSGNKRINHEILDNYPNYTIRYTTNDLKPNFDYTVYHYVSSPSINYENPMCISNLSIGAINFAKTDYFLRLVFVEKSENAVKAIRQLISKYDLNGLIIYNQKFDVYSTVDVKGENEYRYLNFEDLAIIKN